MKSGLLRGVHLGLPAVLRCCAAAVGLSLAAAAPASQPAASAGNGAGVAPAGTRIYQSIDRDGNATFADHAQPGAQSLSVRTYEFTADGGARDLARAEREYWRSRDEAFAQRQQAREQALVAERAAARASPPAGQSWADQRLRFHSRRGSGLVFQHPLAVRPAPYSGSPGAASRSPAAFIGSGFSTAR
ncbi:MAG: hypothetical protein KA169_08675 [Burkholderiaceae bacterium]|nr:hypothetical protein [Burkholderiaceae bacterium]